MNIKDMYNFMIEITNRINIINSAYNEISSHLTSGGKRANKQNLVSLLHAKTNSAFYSESLLSMEPEKDKFIRALGLYEFIVFTKQKFIAANILDANSTPDSINYMLNEQKNILTDRLAKMSGILENMKNLFVDKNYISNSHFNYQDNDVMLVLAKNVSSFEDLSDIMDKLKRAFKNLNKAYTVNMSELQIMDIRKGSLELDVIINIDLAPVLAQMFKFSLLALSVKLTSAANLKGIMSFSDESILKMLEDKREKLIEETINTNVRGFLEAINVEPDGEKLTGVSMAMLLFMFIIEKYQTHFNIQVADETQLNEDQIKQLHDGNSKMAETSSSLVIDHLPSNTKLLGYDKLNPPSQKDEE